jgi:hypothetical protein
MFTKFAEKFKVRPLLAPQATGTAAEVYAAPTPGTMGITILCQAKMANAADLTLSLKYADNATGTNATAFGYNVPIYVDGVRKAADAKAHVIEDASGDFIVEFCIDPGLIPAGKFVGVHYANSNANNLLSTMIIEDTAYKPE